MKVIVVVSIAVFVAAADVVVDYASFSVVFTEET